MINHKQTIELLRGFIWHTTSGDGLRGIINHGAIRVNDGKLPNTMNQSPCSNCFEANAVSLFDIVTHRDEDLLDEDLGMPGKWPMVMFRHRPWTVFLGMELKDLGPNLIFYPELKKRFCLGGIIPRIEICHQGDISVTTIKKIGLWSVDQAEIISFVDALDEAEGKMII